MIRVDSVTIKEFRGIRDLTLDFKGKNFAVCGPNGTGKSGVVDALEFALTGNVSRLSGEGRGDISLKVHGPHVDFRNAPSKARVLVRVTIPSLGKTVTVERTVKTPTSATVTPDEPAVRAVLLNIEKHPEVVLSRRELIKYVLATPGDRSKEVQALLQLDQVEKVRAGLQKAANAFEKEATSLKSAVSVDSESLRTALGVAGLGQDIVLAAANVRRADLGLPPLAELTPTTSLKDGLAAPASSGQQRIPKAQAIMEIAAARKILSELSGDPTTALAAEMRGVLEALASDPVAATGLGRETFYKSGLSLIENEACPLCDTEWDPVKLRSHVQSKLKHLEALTVRREAAKKKLAPIAALMRTAQTALDAVIHLAALATAPLPLDAAREFVASCVARHRTLGDVSPLGDAVTHLSTVSAVPQGVATLLDTFEKVVVALPEPTKHDSAREWLTVAQERLDRYRKAQRTHKTAHEQAEMARKVSDIYQATSDKVLAGIYAKVQDDFASMYAFVNRTDEDKFKAELTPSMGKLGFDVDFYGRGFFPPGAYHSEGHQDGMGLCLYLALMRHIHGSGFTFAVLDDVLMSVDSGHRREVCTLLKRDFPDTQFIMTTHDRIWLNHMRTEALVDAKGTVEFGNWTVEQGPAGFRDGDVWAEIDGDLQKNDVRGAAALLRNYLEYESAELCQRLRAHVEFRGDAQHQLGELLPPAISQLKKLLGEAKKAANSWNNKELVAEIGDKASSFSTVAEASKTDQWQVNAAVHYNEWATLGRNDFAPVAKAYRDLMDGFRCPQCKEFLRVSPPRDKRESLRCECGKTQWSLVEK